MPQVPSVFGSNSGMERTEKDGHERRKKRGVLLFIRVKREKWRPAFTLNGTDVLYNPHPKFLGVHLDRTLSLAKHTEYVTNKASGRCNILSLANKQLGWGKTP